MNPKRIPRPHFTSVYSAVLMLSSMGAMAGPLPLAQAPAGNGGKEPAPNIIVSVDDSGSMGNSGMAALRDALNSAFSPANVADDSIRLGFQAMWRCRGLQAAPYSNSGSCPDTRIRSFSGTHRTNFKNWVDSLGPKNGTPSHSMIANAHAYMSTTGVWSPFANKPGTTETPMLACRKSFHIFMTDGGWKDTENHQGTTALNATNFGLPGNADGSAMTLPDGKVFDPYGSTANDTKIYRDPYDPVINDRLGGTRSARGTVSTFADWAFKMWSTDYAPTIENKVAFKMRQPGEADFGSGYKVPEYWNPKNNPMTWQGVTTYTIGFNNAANVPTSRKTWKQYSGYPTEALESITLPKWGGDSWSGDFSAMVRGDAGLSWPNPLRGWPLNMVNGVGEFDNSLGVDGSTGNNNSGPDYGKIYELWHAALNGRGRFVPATNATELANAFKEILDQVIADSTAPLTSISANTQTVSTETRIYTAGYSATNWSGSLESRDLTTANSVDSTVLWSAAAELDKPAVTPANRLIFTTKVDVTPVPTTFEWSNLGTTQQAALQGSDSASVGEDRLNYLRGDRSKEATASGPFRNRDSRLGDIVNSSIWTVGKPNVGHTSSTYKSFRIAKSTRPTMLYVGANDGMLHGFDAADGKERVAYVPLGVYNNLRSLTDPTYTHRYFVDGQVFTGDYEQTSGDWRTVLVGGLGGGGKGYFLLNVTDPSGWTSSSAANLVMADKTDGADPDIGHMYAEPTLDTSNSANVVQVTKLNNNRWAVVMGNGVNSANEKAVLLVQYLDGDRALLKIEADSAIGGGNGMANPRVIDIDGDGKADVAYAGDRLGNLWKFDLTSNDPANWGSYFKSGALPVPLFVARDDSNTPQPITTAPQWATHPLGGVLLAFGTGQELTVADRTSTSKQTLYAIWDNTKFNPMGSPKMSLGSAITTGRAALAQQTEIAAVPGTNYSKTSTNPVIYSGAGAKRGWYLDWPGLGERSVNNGGKFSDRLVYLRSKIPAAGNLQNVTEESCEPNPTAAEEYITVLDILTAAPPKNAFFDTDGGGFTGTEATGVSRWKTGKEDRLVLKLKQPGKFVSISGRPGGGGGACVGVDCPNEFGTPPRVTDVGWRQLQ